MMCARVASAKSLLVLLLLLTSQLAQGATIRVPLDQPTIEAGLWAASNGDTVLVAPGTYTGYGNWYVPFPQRSITLLSEAGPLHTIIDGTDQGTRCFDLEHASGRVIEGFTFQNGSGALYIGHYATPIIRNCIFRDLYTYRFTGYARGGAVLVNGPAESMFEKCMFMNNRTNFYGELYDGGAEGGALACLAGSMYLSECTFIGNEALSQHPFGSAGGAVYTRESKFQCDRCSFYGNGALEGGALALVVSSSSTIENCIVAFSSEGEAVACPSNADITVSCTNIYGNAGGDWSNCIADELGINGNISEDPLFCDANSDTLTIRSDSPCAPENSPPGCGLIGAWSVGCGITSVPSGQSPSRQIRLRVRPNPILGRASFLFDVQGSSSTIEIYDPQGRLIEMLTGSERVEWLPGNAISSGAYFARMRSRGTNEVVKFIVLK